jgi:hypothetical protein
MTTSIPTRFGEPSVWRGGGFGLALASDQPLLPPARAPLCGEPLKLRRVQARTLREAWQRPSEEQLWRTRFPDGALVGVARGPAGEHRILYGGRAGALALYELSADRRVVRWALEGSSAAAQPGAAVQHDDAAAHDDAAQHDAAAQRFLLDTVLWWTAMMRGFELLHASAVTLASRVLAIAGGTGAGKTSLAIELMDRGASLFADDVLVLRREPTGIRIYPGPPVMNVPDASRERAAGWATPIASFSDQEETWMAVDRTAGEPASLSALIVLDRAASGGLAIRRLPSSPLSLMQWTWGLTSTEARSRESFETLADLAEGVPAYHLSAQPDVSSDTIAELIASTCASGARAA